MSTRISRAERLLNLTAVLLDSRRPLTREELRERVDGYPDDDNSFRRQFERDKDTLREVGIPLTVVDVPFSDHEQGYRIPPDEYYLQGAEFTPAELAALHVATMAVQFGNTDEEALWKLGGLGVTDVSEARSGAMFAGPISELPTDAGLLEVFGAIQRHRPLAFDYRSASGNRRREVEPWSLYFQRGRWYLTGFDRTADGERQFRLDRMRGLEQLDDHPTHPIPVRESTVVLRPWEIGTAEPVEVDFFVAERAVVPVSKRVGSEPIRREALGEIDGAVFRLSVRAVDAFVSFTLEWLEDAVVLGPPEVRAAVIETLTASTERGRS